eukprot:scaffold15605_cov73-Skeletonema_marinoi.AAC.1
MSSSTSSANNPAAPTLLQRIQALDKSSLAPSYTALVLLFYPSPSSQYAVADGQARPLTERAVSFQ